MALLREAKAAGNSTIIITLSSALSGTYQCAVLAKKQLDYGDCYVSA